MTPDSNYQRAINASLTRTKKRSTVRAWVCHGCEKRFLAVRNSALCPICKDKRVTDRQKAVPATDLETRVAWLETHVHNLQQTVRYHDEALTTLFDRPAGKVAETKAEYKT